MNAQIVSISLGQGGIQSSHAAWELYCIEHGIAPDGTHTNDDSSNGDRDNVDVFYFQTQYGALVPRSIIADLEPTVIDEIRTGAYRKLHHPESMINGWEDAANNFARGYYTKGRCLLEPTLDQIRKQTNKCDALQGFYFNNGLGGGTGAGYVSLLIEHLSVEYGKTCKVMMNIFPGPTLSCSVVDPYNVALATSSNIEHSDVNITLDNEACYRVCARNLNILRPSYTNVNRLIAQVSSSISSSFRFQCPINSDLNQLQTNLVPYPRIHFPVVSFAPITNQHHADHDRMDTKRMIKDLFENYCRLISCETTLGKFMACNIIFRGNVSPKEMNDGILDAKTSRSIEFVDWCPTGFKVGLCTRPPLAVPGSNMAQTNKNAVMMSNSTAIRQIWTTLHRKFDMLFRKRAFVHWFVGEGMEESEFNEANVELTSIIDDYNDVGATTNEEEERAAAAAEEAPKNADTASKDTKGTSPSNNSAKNEQPVQESDEEFAHDTEEETNEDEDEEEEEEDEEEEEEED